MATPRSPLTGVQWSLVLCGFLLYLLVITSYRLPVGDVAIVMALVGAFLQRGRIRFPPYLAFLTAFGVWVAVTSTQSAYPDWVSTQLMNLLKVTLIVFVAANAVQTRPQIRLVMVFFLGCFALFPLRGAMLNFFVYGHDMGGRAVWNMLYSNPNDLGAMALLQLSMAVALLASEPKGWVRWCALAGVMMVPLLILMTQSRGVFLGLLVFTAIAFAGHRRRVALTLRLGVVAVVLAAVAPAGVWERIETLQHATSTSNLDQMDGSEGSARQRYEIWRVAVRIIADHPITGVGLGAYKPSHQRYADNPDIDQTAAGRRDTHSLYLNVLAETGYPGLFLYLAAVATALIAAEKARRRCKGIYEAAARQLLLLEAGLAAFMVASIFGSMPYLPHLLLHLVMLHALAMVYQREAMTLRAQGPWAAGVANPERAAALSGHRSRGGFHGTLAGATPTRART